MPMQIMEQALIRKQSAIFFAEIEHLLVGLSDAVGPSDNLSVFPGRACLRTIRKD
jgi:hypothetical protein